MKRTRRAAVAAAVATAVSMGVAGVAQAATTVVPVSGDTSPGENVPGWMFNRDSAAPFQFSFEASSLGSSSLEVLPITSPASDKFIAELFVNGTTVGDFGGVSFDYQLGAGVPSTQADQFYVNVYANFAQSGPDNFYDCRFDLVASTGSDAAFSTLAFDPTAGVTLVTTRNTSPAPCPATLAEMGSDAYVRAIAINVGDTSASDAGVGGFLDNVVVEIGGDTTVYDFGVSADQCKRGGWADFGFKNQGQCVSAVNANGHAGK